MHHERKGMVQSLSRLFIVCSVVLSGSAIYEFSAPREAAAQCMAGLAAAAPYRSGNQVVSVGIGYASGICPAARFDLQAQTKVCGFWGCDWQTRGLVYGNPYAGYALAATQGCRGGKNRYRTKINFCWMPVSWPPTYDCSNEFIHGSQPEFTC